MVDFPNPNASRFLQYFEKGWLKILTHWFHITIIWAEWESLEVFVSLFANQPFLLYSTQQGVAELTQSCRGTLLPSKTNFYGKKLNSYEQLIKVVGAHAPSAPLVPPLMVHNKMYVHMYTHVCN